MAKEAKGHVHFGVCDEVLQQKDNTILVESKEPGSIDIHLGFVQSQHYYKVTVEVPKQYFMGHDLNDIFRAAGSTTPNLNCKLSSIEEGIDHYILSIDFFAYKEKLLHETIALPFSEKSVPVKIIINARVLGRGKGTPLLKNGVKCVGVEMDELSEASDWHGFD